MKGETHIRNIEIFSSVQTESKISVRYEPNRTEIFGSVQWWDITKFRVIVKNLVC